MNNIELDSSDIIGSRHGGVSAKSIIIPAVVLLVCMHALITFNMLRIGRFGAELSQTMQTNFAYLQVSKEFETNSEVLSELVQKYVNTGESVYLNDYFSLVQTMRGQGQAMVEMLRNTADVTAIGFTNETLTDFDLRTQIETHALRLCADVYDLDLSIFPQLAQTQLTAEEAVLSPEDKQQLAIELLSGEEYVQINPRTHKHIGRALRAVSTEASQESRQQSSALGRARTLQWVIAVSCIVLLSVMLLLMFTKLLRPLEQSVEKIQQGEALPDNIGVSEFRRLASSYNALLHHKEMTESYLRKQSQTDALTNLPNRLAFQEFIAHLTWERSHSSVTVFSLDVNGLKEANDRHGHAHGDELLRKCASCILTVFGDEPGCKCFRFGGDEFAAFWINIPESQILPALARFEQEQIAHGVSVSVGYAYTEDLSRTSVDELFEQADKYMYEKKLQYHRENDAP